MGDGSGICAIIGLAIYLLIVYLGNGGSWHSENPNQKFGDGKHMYDFKNYANNKVDKYIKK